VHNFSVDDCVPIRGAIRLGELREIPRAIHPSSVFPFSGGFPHHASFRRRRGIFPERLVAGFRPAAFERGEFLFRRRRGFDRSVCFIIIIVVNSNESKRVSKDIHLDTKRR
tara:strand:- start:112 stop:444 length:333 start_codon:yes stop_codon:yes gene_type:complete